MAGDKVLLEQEYYSVGGGFIEWKGYVAPTKGAPKYPYERMAQVVEHCKRDNISVAQLAMANEIAVSDRAKPRSTRFLDKILGAMDATVKTGINAPTSTLPGPIKLKTKAARRLHARAKAARRGAARHRARIGIRACGL